jgi:putative transposase
MPYKYQQLTPKELEEVLRKRREAGYPLHAPPHPFRQAGTYFITAANYEHAHIMDTADRRTEFEKQLRLEFQEVHAELAAWVILSNHYHFLAGVESFDQISTALKHLHGITSYEWNKADNLTGKRRVWYKFMDRYIRDERHYYCALNYIHINPIKHGYVTDPFNWPWMSLQDYSDLQGHDWLLEKWKNYPPDHFARDLDDDCGPIITT